MATTAAPAQNSSNVSTLSDWAGPYVTNMLGQTQAYAQTPYQVYGGPMTAGESGLQNKVFQGLGSLNFPGNLGASFSSSGAYQPPQMNMGAYNPSPIGVGTPRPTYGQYMDNMNPEQRASAVPQNIYDAGLAGNQVYNQDSNYTGDAVSRVPPPLSIEEEQRIDNLRKQNLSMDDMMRMQGVPGFGGRPEVDPGFGMMPTTSGAPIQANEGLQKTGPGEMPSGGLASLLGRMPQQQPQNIAQQYMNPYLQSVLDPQMAELRRQNDITNMNANAKMTGAGAFGGGRQAILNAENNRNLMQEMNKTVGQGYSNAYDKAQQQFNIEQGQSKTLADLMAQQGGTQRDIEQQGITADYNEFLNQRDYPQKMLQFQQSMLQGLPISTVTNQAAPLSGIAQLSSTVGGLGNIMDSLKKFNLTPG